MPHLQYAKRFWRVASDDFWLPGLCSMLGRSMWIVTLIIAEGLSTPQLKSCPYSGLIFFYINASLVLLLSQIISEGYLVKSSMYGTMTDRLTRDQTLPRYLTIRLALGLVDFFGSIFGFIVLLEQSQLSCSIHIRTDILFFIILAIPQLVESTVFLCCIGIFASDHIDSNNSTTTNDIEENGHSYNNDNVTMESSNFRWKKRLQFCCQSIQTCTCSIFGGHQLEDRYESVAIVLAKFFHHDGFLDIVPSDIVAGISLARILQLEKQQKMHIQYMTSQKKNYENNKNKNTSNGSSSSSSSSSSRTVDISMSSYQNNITTANEKAHINMNTQLTRTETEMNDIEYGSKVNINTTAIAIKDDDDEEEEEDLFEAVTSRRLDPHNQIDKNWIQSTAKYMIYAEAVYSHMWLLYSKPLTGLCHLCWSRCMNTDNKNLCNCTTNDNNNKNISCFHRNHRSLSDSPDLTSRLRTEDTNKSPYNNTDYRVITGDHCFHINEAGTIYLTTRKINAELIFASFHNDLSLKPYAIFYESDTHEVVVAIRGTLSLEDCLTDLDVEPVEMTQAGLEWGFNGTNKYAHNGMLSAALRIRRDLDQYQLLHRLMTSPNRLNKPPKLVIVGHSLGAGTAVLLTIMLRPIYAEVICYSYGTPGSVVDPITSMELQTYVTSVVVGSDLVPRLSFHSVFQLREQILDCICRAKVNKLQISRALFKHVQSIHYMHLPGQESSNPQRDSIRAYMAMMKTRAEASIHRILVIPGRVLHYKKLKQSEIVTPYSFHTTTTTTNNNNVNDQEEEDVLTLSDMSHLLPSCTKKYIYIPYESHYNNFKQIEVAPDMFRGHLMDIYSTVLDKVVDNWK